MAAVASSTVIRSALPVVLQPSRAHFSDCARRSEEARVGRGRGCDADALTEIALDPDHLIISDDQQQAKRSEANE